MKYQVDHFECIHFVGPYYYTHTHSHFTSHLCRCRPLFPSAYYYPLNHAYARPDFVDQASPAPNTIFRIYLQL